MKMSKAARLYEDQQNSTEALIMAHLGMVKRVAVHLKVRLPPFMELDELIQVGMIGLLEAAHAFDPAKGHEFEHFAHPRVRGAILDEVRRLSFLPRSAVAFNKAHSDANHELAVQLGRMPTQAELAEHMGKGVELFHKERSQAHRFETFSVEVVSEEVMNLATDRSQQPDAIVEHQQFIGALASAIEELPEREQLIMKLYYVEELNLKEIGEVLDVTESRVSQVLSGVVKKLRARLGVTPEDSGKTRARKTA